MNREEYLEDLANNLIGERNNHLINEFISKAEEYLDIDSEDIYNILASDYDCIRCLECMEFYHLSDFVITIEDGEMCEECADFQGLEIE